MIKHMLFQAIETICATLKEIISFDYCKIILNNLMEYTVRSSKSYIIVLPINLLSEMGLYTLHNSRVSCSLEYLKS